MRNNLIMSLLHDYNPLLPHYYTWHHYHPLLPISDWQTCRCSTSWLSRCRCDTFNILEIVKCGHHRLGPVSSWWECVWPSWKPGNLNSKVTDLGRQCQPVVPVTEPELGGKSLLARSLLAIPSLQWRVTVSSESFPRGPSCVREIDLSLAEW